MSKNSKITESDQQLFRDAMRNTKPIKHTKLSLQKKPQIINTKKDQYFADDDNFSKIEDLEPVGSEDILHFAKPGIHHKILRNLRNGKYNVEDVLDLHGMTETEAQTALNRFLIKCQYQGLRHILIIHGKGRSNKPILKNALNHWLRQTERVLAFCSPIHKDGRGGALYVLLRSLSK